MRTNTLSVLIATVAFLSVACASDTEGKSISDKAILSGEIVSTSDYPWWDEIKYPKVINLEFIGNNTFAISYRDSGDNKCEGVPAFYDAEIDAFVFKSCLPHKGNEIFTVIFLLRKFGDGQAPVLEVRTYKKLFEVR